ncbi:HEAT repeat domain-containing protein [Candidatus Poribacteria bacterium]
MSREKGSLGIRDVLREKDVDLWKRLEEIWRNAEPMFAAIEEAVDKSAAEAHSIEVERDISALIPDDRKKELGPIELFSLSVAACLHDADKALGTPKGKHGDVASANVGIYPEDYDLDRGQADVVRWIIRMHDHGDFRYDLPPDPLPIGGGIDVYIKPLAALFRLADILHADYRRVVSARPEEAKERARVCIRGWKYDDEGRIVFRAVPEELPDIEHIHKAIAMMREAIESIAPILRDAGYAHEIADTEIDNSILKDKVRAKHEDKQKSERSFIGMDSFNEDDEHLFKGREKESNELYELLLLDDPIIALVGDSGTGKTSLIRAGLFPILRKAGWKFAYTRPLHEPASDMIRDVWLTMMKGKVPDNIDLVEMFERVSEENRGKDLLIVMDQFEDLFRFPDAPEQMAKALYPVQAVRFRDLRVLLSYRADAEGQVGPILQDVAQSFRAMNGMHLKPLDRDGAKEALTAGFDAAQIGFGSKGLMKLILDDIEAQGSKFYPPYIQMIGETLTDKAEDRIVTRSIYDSLGGAGNIIGRYLFNQLESFGDRREDVERILVELTSVAGLEGRKARTRSLDNLERDLGMAREDLEELFAQIGKKWMIRHLGDGQYEIIHDHLAKLVDEKLIASEEERELRQLRDHLATAARIYSSTRILLESAFMAKLYQNRERLTPSSGEKITLLHSCFAGRGPMWYWLQDGPSVKSLPGLWDMLKDGEIDVQRSAAQTLVQLATANEMQHMLRSKYSVIRIVAAQAVARLGDMESISKLRVMLKDRYWAVRVASAYALARLDDREAIPEIRAMQREGYGTVRIAAAQALAQLGDREIIPELRGMLRSERWNTRIAAAQALAQLGDREGITELMNILTGVSNILTGTSQVTRMPGQKRIAQAAAVHVLVQLGDRRIMSELWEFLETQKKGRRAIALVLAGMAAIPELREMLSSQYNTLRIAAAQALARLGDREVIPELRNMLMEKTFRAAAAQALAQLGDREVIPELRNMLMEETFRTAAAQALAQLGDREVIPKLRDMLRDARRSVRDAAVVALTFLNSEEDISFLLDIAISGGEGASAAREALICIDHNLYCPFDWPEDSDEQFLMNA